jgi:hypothetical protein
LGAFCGRRSGVEEAREDKGKRGQRSLGIRLMSDQPRGAGGVKRLGGASPADIA